MYEPCMCGATDCTRCFPGQSSVVQMLPWTPEEFDAMADDEPCCYCGGPVDREKCLDRECEGS